MSKNRQNKSIQYDLLPYILADGAELVGKYKFPQLLPQKKYTFFNAITNKLYVVSKSIRG